MKAKITPGARIEREWSKMINECKRDAEEAILMARRYKDRFRRHIKKSKEIMRLNCKWRSKDGTVWVCDHAGDGPVRCNRNTMEECPLCILLEEPEI